MEDISRGTWFCLESIAEGLYDKPEVFKVIAILIFRKLPCSVCAKDSLDYIDKVFPRDPIKWVCDHHNRINKKQNKKEHKCPCSYQSKTQNIFSHSDFL